MWWGILEALDGLSIGKLTLHAVHETLSFTENLLTLDWYPGIHLYQVLRRRRGMPVHYQIRKIGKIRRHSVLSTILMEEAFWLVFIVHFIQPRITWEEVYSVENWVYLHLRSSMYEIFHEYFPKGPHWQQRLQNQKIQEVSLLRWLKIRQIECWLCQLYVSTLLKHIVCVMVSGVNLRKFRITWETDFWHIYERLSYHLALFHSSDQVYLPTDGGT